MRHVANYPVFCSQQHLFKCMGHIENLQISISPHVAKPPGFPHPQGATEGARGDAGTSEASVRGRVPGPGQPAAHHAGVPGAAAALHRDSARR